MARHDDDDDRDDDRPRRRKRRDDDDDYEWERRGKRRRGGDRGGGKTALTLLAIGGGLLLLCGGGLVLLPAVVKLREAAKRSTEMNSLKQIGVGVHHYASVNNNRLPQADGDLSWRVYILPYIEQDSVYRQFDLNAAWNQGRNKTASETFIKTYISPLDDASSETRYRAFVGDGTAFDTKLWTRGFPSFITDGTSTTIMVIDTAETVPWAAPMEIPVSPGGRFPAFGNPKRDQALIAFWDGSVRAAEKSRLDAARVRALASAAGNESIPADW